MSQIWIWAVPLNPEPSALGHSTMVARSEQKWTRARNIFHICHSDYGASTLCSYLAMKWNLLYPRMRGLRTTPTIWLFLREGVWHLKLQDVAINCFVRCKMTQTRLLTWRLRKQFTNRCRKSMTEARKIIARGVQIGSSKWQYTMQR